MADINKLYPDIEAVDLNPEISSNFMSEFISRVSAVHDDELKLQIRSDNSCNSIGVNNGFTSLIDHSFTHQINLDPECLTYTNKNSENRKSSKYFYYDTPFNEDTGAWIPISTPPMSASDHDEFSRGFLTNGAYFPDGDISWPQLTGENREMTMWDVLSEILLAARGKMTSFSMNEFRSCKLPGIPTELLEQAWNEMAHTLTEASFGNAKEILDTEPPRWLADSVAAACMLCNVKFHPIMCSRHHCRFCGGLFCNECSKGRCLLPSKFRILNPKRVCDVCFVRLEFVQPYLMDRVSRAAQLPTHDLTDLSTLRSWLNFPWGQSMESEIFKAANTVKDYCTKVGSLKPEKSIPDAILRQAKGLAILTVAKVGMMITYNVGTGLIIARRDDGSWSPPSAISTIGIGWGAQAGGELTDFIIILRTKEAVKNFSGNCHISFGAGISAAVGIVGRAAEAELHAGAGGFAACYTYSRSKGAFLGCSLEGSILTTRVSENCRFYGSPAMSSLEILLGALPRPPAAAVLYNALSDLFQKLEK